MCLPSYLLTRITNYQCGTPGVSIPPSISRLGSSYAFHSRGLLKILTPPMADSHWVRGGGLPLRLRCYVLRRAWDPLKAPPPGSRRPIDCGGGVPAGRPARHGRRSRGAPSGRPVCACVIDTSLTDMGIFVYIYLYL